jgi:hypothetical protein
MSILLNSAWPENTFQVIMYVGISGKGNVY